MIRKYFIDAWVASPYCWSFEAYAGRAFLGISLGEFRSPEIRISWSFPWEQPQYLDGGNHRYRWRLWRPDTSLPWRWELEKGQTIPF